MKKIVILGASGMLGSHLCIEYAMQGHKVFAVTRSTGVVAEAISKYAQLRMTAEVDNMFQMADMVVDCSQKPARYKDKTIGNIYNYSALHCSNVISLSSTIMNCEHNKLGEYLNPGYSMELYCKEQVAINRGSHVLRLPVMTIEGHYLDRETLIASGRIGLDYNLLRANEHEQFNAIEHRNSVRDYIPISHLSEMIERTAKHVISYACSGKPKTLQQQIEHLVRNSIVGKKESFLDNVTYDDSLKLSNHYKELEHLPNVFGE